MDVDPARVPRRRSFFFWYFSGSWLQTPLWCRQVPNVVLPDTRLTVDQVGAEFPEVIPVWRCQSNAGDNDSLPVHHPAWPLNRYDSAAARPILLLRPTIQAQA